MNMRPFAVLSSLVFCLVSFPTSAGIFLDRVVVEFSPQGLPREDLVVFNDSQTENAYVDVTLLEVVNPGTEQEQRVQIDDPTQSQLLVTPVKMVIPPGGKTQVRLVSLVEDNPTDRIYRVNFTPVLPPLAAEESAVRVVVAYQALVIIPPTEPFSELEYEREGNQLVFTNSGNSYVKLEAGEVCSNGECQTLPTTRLYAGNEWLVDLPTSGTVSYRAVNDRSTRVIQID